MDRDTKIEFNIDIPQINKNVLIKKNFVLDIP